MLLWLTSRVLADPPQGNPPAEANWPRRFEFQRTQMGVPFAAAFYACDEEAANKAISAVWTRIESLNSLMSDYDSNSELMRLCRDSGPGKPVRVSPELFRVLSKSVEVSELSGGAFDVSVGPLVKLWRRARRQKEMPDVRLLQEARALVGFRNIRLDPPRNDRANGHSAQHGTVELLKPGMKLDLGGIAVGYACDEAIKVLKEHGITRAMVDGSGDIVVSDPPPCACGWRIGIASLREPDAEPKLFARLANCSISTSGDAFQFVELGGKRYSHIVDPQTGLGLTERCSVTVIAPDGITADALATAVSVLGPERGLKLIESQSCAAALFATLDGERLRSAMSSRFSVCLESTAGR
ncbi:MAG TPA: FAD:protein FMN transferase [Planctomycetaceae bacterium]|nr:FAD:protein FMN transferase [Planctomycetaceae bacterium]